MRNQKQIADLRIARAPERTGPVLMNPGPVNTSARVRSALVSHELCHRDPEYARHLVRLTRKLRTVFGGGPEHETVVFTGSGTAASECVISSVVPPGRKLLVLDNGTFGERLAHIAAVHGLEVVHLHYPHGEEIRIDDVRAALAADDQVAAVAMCHHETSVGLLNPVREVSELCGERLLLVDAISSLGAEDIDVVRDGIDVCWSSANKALHGIAGVSFACVAPRVWPRIAGIPTRVFYLDLRRYRRSLADAAQTPFTPAVQTTFALEAACDEWLEDGRPARLALYRARNEKLRQGLRALGFSPFTETGHESHGIVTARLPDGVSFAALFETVRARGFVIYDCKPPLQGRYIQIANMGVLDDGAIDGLLVAVASGLAAARAATADLAYGRAGHSG